MGTFTIDDAIVMAAIAHRGQRDKGRPNLPYITHPMRVMAEFDDHRICQMIAVLHDAVEDTPLTLEEIRDAGAPDRVVAGIEALTHRNGEPDEEYWVRVCGNPDAVAVKLVDIDDNSDPRRLKLLPTEEAKRLSDKYARARTVLLGTPAIPKGLREAVEASGGTITQFDSRRSDQREVVLRDTGSAGGGTMNITISMDASGTFRWRVTYLHHDGSSDYEWVSAVPPDRVHKLVAALGGHEDDHLLELVQGCYEEGVDIPEVLKGDPVNAEFSNWIS